MREGGGKQKSLRKQDCSCTLRQQDDSSGTAPLSLRSTHSRFRMPHDAHAHACTSLRDMCTMECSGKHVLVLTRVHYMNPPISHKIINVHFLAVLTATWPAVANEHWIASLVRQIYDTIRHGSSQALGWNTKHAAGHREPKRTGHSVNDGPITCTLIGIRKKWIDYYVTLNATRNLTVNGILSWNRIGGTVFVGIKHIIFSHGGGGGGRFLNYLTTFVAL